MIEFRGRTSFAKEVPVYPAPAVLSPARGGVGVSVDGVGEFHGIIATDAAGSQRPR